MATSTQSEPRAVEAPHVRVAVIGSGFSGIGAGRSLLKAGVDDFVILERAGDLGGTWRDNTYPGAACDVPSNLYCFSYAPNPTWSRSFSPQPEIQEYLRRCAREFGLDRHLRFNHEVRGTRWNGVKAHWELDTAAGPYTAEVVFSAGGPLADPAVPDIRGLDGFAGPVWHSSRWRHDVDLAGKRVAVIGTGASAVQFVPQVQKTAAQVDVYQRTAPWILPRMDRGLTGAERALYKAAPVAQRVVREGLFWTRELVMLRTFRGPERTRTSVQAEQLARHNIARHITDPELRAKVTPDYTIGCKRILLSDDYYAALAEPNVELVTEGIEEVRPHGVVTRDGVEHAADVIILGTGFRATDLPVMHRVTGRDGLLLADAWKDGMRAHQGAMTSGFPNLFFIIGPNTGLGHSSMTVVIEAQVKYAVDAVVKMERHGIAEVEVKPETEAEWDARLQGKLADTVWLTGGCNSWYLDQRTGRNTTLWPEGLRRFRQINRKFSPVGHRMRTWRQVREAQPPVPK